MTGIAPPPARPRPSPPSAAGDRGLRLLLIIGIPVLVTLLVVAGVTAAFLPIAFPTRVHERLDVRAGSSTRVAVSDASFEFAPSTDGRVHVVVTGRAAVPPSISAHTTQGRTDIEGGCSARVWWSPCSLHLAVTMPPASDLSVSGTNGGVVTRDIHGAIDVEITNGMIDLRSASGTLRLHSTNGLVRISDATASSVRAETTNGTIDLDLTAVPASVDAHSTNGTVTVRVPDSGTYAVSAHTTNGAVDTSSVRTDPASPNRISVETTNGAVRVLPSSQ